MIGALERHDRIALSFSGGKDSLACAYRLRPLADRVTVYHVDTGDFLPETHEIVRHVEAMFPKFVRIETDVAAWIERHGLPSDLVPYHSHPFGRVIGQAAIPLTGRYDCCFHNQMLPVFRRVREDGHTVLVRGTKRSDMPKLPVADGDSWDGLEFVYPVQDWTDAEVIAYLRAEGAPVSRVYDYAKASLDCGTCPAWWTDRRGAYLRQHHPERYAIYQTRLAKVAEALRPTIATLMAELL